ncbi:eukaryotic translation initiation factor 4E type 2 isoform X2 [Aricia agestis]|uniref:eukaryotic translation initiation factor 4E type 2 isoform X1 n=1 Tax=Aricia agestis TaxID=91739 RepID=UPI001C20259B|nr:eukaryotic translation initiation factor 4E type 2 isoform X1 [Aricia agestis]XP_041968490.1 eukaryotic translation initiation factor 4E type 2 isoform X2 [Aricia agestis]
MTERKMCKFYNLNVPERRTAESVGLNHGHNDEDDRNPDERDPLEPYVPPHEHRLEYSYWMWFSRRPPARELAATTGYGQALRMVGRVASVEQWWGLYSHLARPYELPPLSDLHLFKLGIKPMWEDPANVNGGKWTVRLRKSQTVRAWEDLCMAMLGEQFMVGPELCGVVLSVRFQEDHLAVWHRTAADTAASARVRDAMRRILQLPASVPIEYKAHGDRLRASASRAQDDERAS